MDHASNFSFVKLLTVSTAFILETKFLCQDLLSYAEKHSQFYNALKYVTFEIGPEIEKNQNKLLKKFLKNGKWENANWEDILKRGREFKGCFISNELIDSFPVHLLTLKDETLSEIYVTYKNGQLKESIGKLSTNEQSKVF